MAVFDGTRCGPGEPITPSMLWTALNKACNAVGIQGFTFHDFTHCVETRWHKDNVPPKVAMLAMGWSSPAMMLRYTNIKHHDVAEQFGTAACTKIVKTQKRSS